MVKWDEWECVCSWVVDGCLQLLHMKMDCVHVHSVVALPSLPWVA